MAPAVLAVTAVGLFLVLSAGARDGDHDDGDREDGEHSKVQIGFEIAPVDLDLRGKNRALVGLGSYIVNAQSSCSDCHTSPNFAPGGNPYLGQPEQINTADYLGGGRRFPGGIVSRNLTPDPITGLPADLTLDQFKNVIHTGADPDNPGRLLQIMPWPVFRNMRDRDLEAIYEYLSAIPSLP